MIQNSWTASRVLGSGGHFPVARQGHDEEAQPDLLVVRHGARGGAGSGRARWRSLVGRNDSRDYPHRLDPLRDAIAAAAPPGGGGRATRRGRRVRRSRRRPGRAAGERGEDVELGDRGSARRGRRTRRFAAAAGPGVGAAGELFVLPARATTRSRPNTRPTRSIAFTGRPPAARRDHRRHSAAAIPAMASATITDGRLPAPR